MAVSTRLVELDADGSVTFKVEPCFFAGHSGGTVVDALAGTMSAFYTHGTMPFVQGDFTVSGAALGEVILFLDFTA